SELCVELPSLEPAKDYVPLDLGRCCSCLVDAGVLFGDSLEAAIALLAVLRGFGSRRVRYSREAERQVAHGERSARPVRGQPKSVDACRLRNVCLRGIVAGCLSGHGAQAHLDGPV